VVDSGLSFTDLSFRETYHRIPIHGREAILYDCSFGLDVLHPCYWDRLRLCYPGVELEQNIPCKFHPLKCAVNFGTNGLELGHRGILP
jgi:hypothetical protein